MVSSSAVGLGEKWNGRIVFGDVMQSERGFVQNLYMHIISSWEFCNFQQFCSVRTVIKLWQKKAFLNMSIQGVPLLA